MKSHQEGLPASRAIRVDMTLACDHITASLQAIIFKYDHGERVAV
jgi:hypothetical protein